MSSRNNKPGRIIKGTAKTPTLKEASGVWTLDEAMQAHRANAWPQPNLLQPVSKSLRAKKYDSNGTYGLRFGGRVSTPTQATFSGWVKRGNNSFTSDHFIFGSNQYVTSTTIPPILEIIFKGNNGGANDHSLTVAIENASFSYYTSTSALFRDMAAWYHIHVVYDSTQTTNTDRIKIWVNGVQLTSMSANNWPTQGYTIGTQTPSLGCLYLNGSPTRFFDGEMAEFNFVEGYALPPSLFGQTGPNGTWIPIAYTGSYGTNGFYLPFTNNTTSQTLGYDASNTRSTVYNADQDPYRGSVTLHLTGNGPAGRQNNTFVDSSINNFAITRNGSTTQGSFSPFPMPADTPYNPAIHGGSGYFNGTTTGAYITTPNDTAFQLTNSSFTIEFWAFTTDTSATAFAMARTDTGANGTNGMLLGHAADATNLYWYATSAGASWDIINAGVICTLASIRNRWAHFAFVRNGSTFTAYVNGIQTYTTTSSASIYQAANGFRIGTANNTSDATNFGGYISNFRYIKGTALYTGNFTPPRRPLTANATNLFLNSEDPTNANYFWSNYQSTVTVTANAAVAPDGTPTAVLLVPAASNNQHTWRNSFGPTVGSTYTYSVYYKSAGAQYANLFVGGGNPGAVFDIINGTVTYSTGLVSSSITDAKNGWWRCTITQTAQAGNGNIYYGVGSVNNGFGSTTTGSEKMYFWGPQVELSSTVSAYYSTPSNSPVAPALLLNFANAAVVDSAGAQNLVTASNATITSASKYGSGALTFNGSTDYLNGTVGYTFGSNDWTIEGWINSKSDGNVIRFNQFSIAILVSGGKLYYYITSNGSVWNIAGGTLFSSLSLNGNNIWYHFALVRNKGIITPYLDGLAGTVCSIGSNAIGGDGGFLRVATEGTGFNGGFGGQLDDIRITNGVARYTTNFTPPARALPETGGKSFVTTNWNAGVVKTFGIDGVNIVSASIYASFNGLRAANYTVQYSDDNVIWTTAFSGVMSNNSAYGIQTGTVTSGGSGTTGTGSWGRHLYWRYVEGVAVTNHHPRTSRIMLNDPTGASYVIKWYYADNTSDAGQYIIGTVNWMAYGPTKLTNWTCPRDVTSVELLVVAGGGAGGAGGGGGGAGGLIYNPNYPVTPGQTYTVTVGAGGAEVPFTTNTINNGSNSTFGALTAIGGGGGSSNGSGTAGVGGSGGGGGYNVIAGSAGTAGQGFAGGTGVTGTGYGGGGGGAGAVGNNGVTGTTSGSGGVGLQFGISGSPTYYAGGGGGTGIGSPGGLGGGGTGGNSDANGTLTAGTISTGGGGGAGGNGAYHAGSSAGGSGVVILRYTTATEPSSTTDDSLVDSPTNYGHDYGNGGEVVGNYATLNPLNANTTYVNLTNGNLTYQDTTAGGSYQGAVTNLFANSGKWYAEFTAGAAAGGIGYWGIGIASPPKTTNFYPEQTVTGYAGYIYQGYDGRKANNDTYVDYGDTYTAGDVISVAVDIDNLKVWFAKNGVWQASGNPLTGANPAFTIQSGLPYGFTCNNSASSTQVYVHCNFGQRPWVFTPPAGYIALNTKNLPRPAIEQPNQHFDVLTYTGNGSTQTITGLNFQPDLVWSKSRSAAGFNILRDSVRGPTIRLISDGTYAELDDATYGTFTSNGLSLGSNVNHNSSGVTYTAWCWKAGGTAVSNTAGTITSSVSANPTSGFSVVTYTGTPAATATIGHGLGIAPSFIIVRSRTDVGNWLCYHSALGPTYGIFLNSANASFSGAGSWNSTAPSSTVFSLAQGNLAFNNNSNHVAYCWAEVPGFSKFGSYVGNGSADGPFIYCGFRPRWIMTKASSASGYDWWITDAARNPSNVTNYGLRADTNGVEVTDVGQDIVSNGFKYKNDVGAPNISGVTYIFAAFAETPVNIARAR